MKLCTNSPFEDGSYSGHVSGQLVEGLVSITCDLYALFEVFHIATVCSAPCRLVLLISIPCIEFSLPNLIQERGKFFLAKNSLDACDNLFCCAMWRGVKDQPPYCSIFFGLIVATFNLVEIVSACHILRIVLTSNIFATCSWLCGLFACLLLITSSTAASMCHITFALAFLASKNIVHHTCTRFVVILWYIQVGVMHLLKR